MINLRKYPYLTLSVVAIVVATVVWMLVPKYYGAQTKISDEYKESDLAIGLDFKNVFVRDIVGSANKGINDIEVYCRLLKSYDMARKISRTQVPGKGVTYGVYLDEKDTLDAIRDNISYNVSVKQQTLTIQFEDRDPLVASQMLDSVVAELQTVITTRRREMAKANYDNAVKARYEAGLAYKQAEQRYAAFIDSHFDLESETDKQQADKLEKDVYDTYSNYEKAAKTCTRHQMLMSRDYSSFAVVKGNSVPTENNSFLIGYVLLALFITLTGWKAYELYRSRQPGRLLDAGTPSSPWSITLILWGVLMFAMLFRDPSLLYAPTSQFYTSLIIWLVLFTVTSFATYNLLPETTGDREQREASSVSPIRLRGLGRTVFYVLLTLSVIITPLYVKKVMDIVMMFGTEDLMNNMRVLAVYGEGQGFLNYSIVINETLMIVALWSYPNVKLWQVVLACCGSLLNSLAIMEKGGLLLLIFCVIFLLYQRKVIRMRSIVIIGVVVVVLAYGFTFARLGKAEVQGDDDFSLFKFIAMYLLSPPVAYCTLSHELVPQFGAHTFPLVYLFMNKFGLGNYVFFDRLQDFVFVPVSTNVYTIFQPFYMDFGQLGIVVFAVVYGVMTGWAYRQMRNGKPFGKCLYMYMAYVLALQFFQEYIFTGNLHIVQLVLFIYLCTQDKFTFQLRKRDNGHTLKDTGVSA